MSRRSVTRFAVALLCGRVVGMTLNTAVVPAEFTDDGVTDATPAVFATSFCIVVSSDWLSDLDCFGSFTTTASSPFTPTPKPVEIRS